MDALTTKRLIEIGLALRVLNHLSSYEVRGDTIILKP